MQAQFFPLFNSGQDVLIGRDDISRMVTKLSRQKATRDAGFELEIASEFLHETWIGQASNNSFKNYRNEVNKFLNWAWFVNKNSPITEMRCKDILSFLDFCSNPPLELISTASHAQIKDDEINPKWKPFVKRNGEVYQRKTASIDTQLSALSSFYNYMIREGIETANPAHVAKSKIKTSNLSTSKQEMFISLDISGKSLSVEQMSRLLTVTNKMANDFPEKHERTRFLILLMYMLFPRISEVSARPGFVPMMGHFSKHKGSWVYFIPNSKGGKARAIGVPTILLEALKRYRLFMGLSPLPTKEEETPLFPRQKAASHGRDKGKIDAAIGIEATRDIVMSVFEQAAISFDNEDDHENACALRSATPHHLRHSGITHDLDIRHRDIHLVSRDAGHSDIAVTSLYISKDTKERYTSSENKDLSLFPDYDFSG